MILDFLFPKNRGKVQPVGKVGPSDAGLLAHADGVNWNPLGTGTPGWVLWTGSAWVTAINSTGCVCWHN